MTPGDSAALRDALKAEFGDGVVVFKDEVATVEVNISGVADVPMRANINTIPVRIVEPKLRDRGWFDMPCWGPNARADFAKVYAVSFSEGC